MKLSATSATQQRLRNEKPSAAPPECVVHFRTGRIARETVRSGFGAMHAAVSGGSALAIE